VSAPPYRIGIGYDIHRLEPEAGGRIVIAGVSIPCDLRLVAHSDGDVVLHALVDALLGAVAAGDLGERFPDTDPTHAGRDSSDFVRETLALPELRDWRIANLDVNVIAQSPRLGDHKPTMRSRLQELFDLPADRVGLKARSKERCDATGRSEAIECQAAILLHR